MLLTLRLKVMMVAGDRLLSNFSAAVLISKRVV